MNLRVNLLQDILYISEKQDFDGKIVINNLHNYNNKKAQKYNKYSNFK